MEKQKGFGCLKTRFLWVNTLIYHGFGAISRLNNMVADTSEGFLILHFGQPPADTQHSAESLVKCVLPYMCLQYSLTQLSNCSYVPVLLVPLCIIWCLVSTSFGFLKLRLLSLVLLPACAQKSCARRGGKNGNQTNSCKTASNR